LRILPHHFLCLRFLDFEPAGRCSEYHRRQPGDPGNTELA
jgi:hypothetical protein